MSGQDRQVWVAVGDYEFTIDLDEVVSIIVPPKMVRLPAARGAFTRAFKYQDEVGAAVSVRIKLGLPERESMDSGQILLGRINGRLAGFWFDRVNSLLHLGRDLEPYEPATTSTLPSSPIDGLNVHRGHIIPHTTLTGLLRLEEAEALAQWWAQELPRLEAAWAEAQVAVETEVAPAPPTATEPEPAEIGLDEFYSMLDAAGLGVEETVVEEVGPVIEAVADLAPPVPPIEVEAATTPAPVVGPRPEPLVEASVAEPVLPLAVPVAAEVETPPRGEGPGAVESSEPAENPRADALFALERKRNAYRQVMQQEAETSLTDFQIIKVEDRSPWRVIRRVLRRLLLVVVAVALTYLTVEVVGYSQKNGNPLTRVWVEGRDGGTDWQRSRAALVKEGQRFRHYLGRHGRR